MIRGIQNALASLNQASDLQFVRWSAPAACRARTGSSSAPRGTDSEPSASAASISQCSRLANNSDQPRQSKSTPRSRCKSDASGPNTRTVLRDRKWKMKNRYLACPFQKEDIIHGRHTTCKYAGAASMSTLRTHLASQQHRGSLPFIELCSSCKEYVVSASLWESSHISGLCVPGSDKPRVQIRNSPSNNSRVGAQWLRLFERLFPTSQRLPSPCEYCMLVTAMISLTQQ